MSMEMSFFTMPRAQTWHAWIWFRPPDTIVFTNQDNVHVLSRLPIPSRSRDGEGRPRKDESVKKDISMLMHLSKGNYLALSKGQEQFSKS